MILRAVVPEVRTLSFLFFVNNITYTKKPSLKASIDGSQADFFVASVWGRVPKTHSSFAMRLYLTEEEFNAQTIHANDLLRIGNNIFWELRQTIRFKNRDVSKVSKQHIQFDEQGAFFYEYHQSFEIRVPHGEWTIYENSSEDLIGKLGEGENQITLEFDKKFDLLDFNGGQFVLEDWEYDTLKIYADKEIPFQAYYQRLPMKKRIFIAQFTKDENDNLWIVTLKATRALRLKRDDIDEIQATQNEKVISNVELTREDILKWRQQ